MGISKSVIAVNQSALPWTICSHSTTAARVGAARKNVLIQPTRTEVSTIARTPKIQKKRQAASRVFSDIIGIVSPQRHKVRRDRTILRKFFFAYSASPRKNPQDFSRVVYKMMLESRARARLSKNKAGMKRTG